MIEFDQYRFEGSPGLLSKPDLLREIENGYLIVDPLTPDLIKTSSIDVRIGENFFRPDTSGLKLFNGWSEEHVRTLYKEPQVAQRAEEVFTRYNTPLTPDLRPDSQVILIYPGETLLCHTEEFIGGRIMLNTMMKARSSMGRIAISVCKCAGWGDIGYINRWTMEVQNELSVPQVIAVGRRVAQITFFRTSPVVDESYADSGKYQTATLLSEVKASWTPQMMLPKLWLDKDI